MPGGVGRNTTIDVVETIYADLGRDDVGAWLARVTAAVTSCIGATRGAVAHTYHAEGHPSQWTISRPIVHDCPPELADVVVRSFSDATPEFLHYAYRTVGPTGTLSEIPGIDLAALLSAAEGRTARDGVPDQIYVNATNADHAGILIAVNVPARRTLVPAERRRLGMIAAHIAAAHRLAKAEDRREIAIFEPRGRAVHVEPTHEPMLAALRERVTVLERARSKEGRGDADRALAAWQALLAGEYTLLDRFEADGRRYVVAHPNEPKVRDPRGLTQREAVVATLASRGHADKLIAYELGIAQGTVTALMNRVLRKLGARSRTELVRLLATPTALDRVSMGSDRDFVVLSTDDGARAHDAVFAGLSPHEREVVRAAAAGRSNAEIANERGVSTNTVAKQLTSSYRKLGVQARADLVRLARAKG